MATTPTGTSKSANDSLDALRQQMNRKPAEKKSAAVEAQDRFMKLLVTQMQNQDPLSPMDNAQFTSQLAQLSTVTGIDTLNDTLKSMQTASTAAQTMQAAGIIGHGVLASGSGIELKNGKGMFGVELSAAVENVKVTITNNKGEEVAHLDMGVGETGSTPMIWDGRDDNNELLPDGQYRFKISATNNGVERTVKNDKGEAISVATPLAFGTVQSVSTSVKNGIALNAYGFSGPLSMSDVRQIL
ncbi:MAG TPA: flagellar hook assembly protein FlgD [Burkholderiaceae bacterium]